MMKLKNSVCALALTVCSFSIIGLGSFICADSTYAASNLNSIVDMQSATVNGAIILTVTTAQPLSAPPASFSVLSPARIAFDFSKTGNGLGEAVKTLQQGPLRSANIVQAGDRTRMVLNLDAPIKYDVAVKGNNLIITLGDLKANEVQVPQQGQAVPMVSAQTLATAKVAPIAVSGTAAPTFPAAPLTTQKSAVAASAYGVRDITFRRGGRNEGRVLVDLGDPNVTIDVRRSGSDLLVDFIGTNAPKALERRMNVADLNTPVSSVTTRVQRDRVSLRLANQGFWEHNAYQSDNQFVLEVRQTDQDAPRSLFSDAGSYKGEKLSLNFQNIDVRAVLQAIAEFSSFNIITSDSVQGSLTLRLKDVPWDQALDIILQAKGLDKRQRGNVIWIAPRDELATREKLEAEASSQLEDLQPLAAQTFRINYHKASTIYTYLKAETNPFLSKRGSAIVDERSNKLFVQDVPSKLEEMRKLIQEIDKPNKQVIIEARIVEADDNFARDLGIRLGFLARLGGNGPSFGSDSGTIPNRTVNIGAGANSIGYQTGQVEDQPDYIPEAFNVNFPAAAIGGVLPSAFSFALFNSNASKLINLELSALETDGRGKVVSRPKILTADQIEAIIEQGVEIPYQQATSSGATSVSFRKANLSLKVKPQITPDGRVVLTLDINKDTPNTRISTGSGVAIDTKHVATEVMVDNGGTVVIGGIYQETILETTSKVPYLGDLPYVGRLFREDARSNGKSELLVFITPRIADDQFVQK